MLAGALQIEESCIPSTKMIAVKIVVDAYAWIKIFSWSSVGKTAIKHTESADMVITPNIVLSEIARNCMDTVRCLTVRHA
ncbi:MAG: hypothetical protein ACYCPP_09600 [Nitrososphaerales archaeon]